MNAESSDVDGDAYGAPRWNDDAPFERTRHSVYQGYNLLVAASGTNSGPSRDWLRALALLRAVGLLQLSALVLWLPGCIFCDDSQSNLFLFFLQLRPRFASWGGFLALFWTSIALLAVLIVCLFLFFCKRETGHKTLTAAVRWWVALLLVLEAPALLGSFGPAIACRGGALEEFPSVDCLSHKHLVIAVFAIAAVVAVVCLSAAPVLLFDPRPSAHAALARSTPRPDLALAAVKTFLLLLALFSRDRGALRGGFQVAGAALYAVVFYRWLPPLRTGALLWEAYLSLLPLPCAALGLAFCAAPGCAAPAAFWPALAGVVVLTAPASALLIRARATAAAAAARSERLSFLCGDACHDVATRMALAEEPDHSAASRSLAARLAPLGLGRAPGTSRRRPRRRRPGVRSGGLRAAPALCVPPRPPRSGPLRFAGPGPPLHGLGPQSPSGAARRAFFLEHQRAVEREEWGEEGHDVTELLAAIGREERSASLRAAAFWTVVRTAERAAGSDTRARQRAELSMRALAAEESKQRALRMYGHLLQTHPHSVRVLRRFAAFQAAHLFDIEGAIRTEEQADQLVEQHRVDRLHAVRAPGRGPASPRPAPPRPVMGLNGLWMLLQRAQADREARAPPSSARAISIRMGSLRGGASSAASTLKRRWAHGSAAQRRDVAADVRARYHRAFAVLHAAALLSVLALLAALLANYLVVRSNFRVHRRAADVATKR
eukprot:tig00000058_g736.t1